MTESWCARVAELADAPASGAGSRKGVEVRVLSRAPLLEESHQLPLNVFRVSSTSNLAFPQH